MMQESVPTKKSDWSKILEQRSIWCWTNFPFTLTDSTNCYKQDIVGILMWFWIDWYQNHEISLIKFWAKPILRVIVGQKAFRSLISIHGIISNHFDMITTCNTNMQQENKILKKIFFMSKTVFFHFLEMWLESDFETYTKRFLSSKLTDLIPQIRSESDCPSVVRVFLHPGKIPDFSKVELCWDKKKKF